MLTDDSRKVKWKKYFKTSNEKNKTETILRLNQFTYSLQLENYMTINLCVHRNHVRRSFHYVVKMSKSKKQRNKKKEKLNKKHKLRALDCGMIRIKLGAKKKSRSNKKKRCRRRMRQRAGEEEKENHLFFPLLM